MFVGHVKRAKIRQNQSSKSKEVDAKTENKLGIFANSEPNIDYTFRDAVMTLRLYLILPKRSYYVPILFK